MHVNDEEDLEMQTVDSLQKRITELEQQLDLLYTLINTLPDLVYAKDTDSNFLVANQTLANMLGVESPTELIGTNDFEYFEEELARKYYNDEQQLLASGERMLNIEEPTVDKDGNQRWLLTSKVPVRNSQGKLTGFVGVGRDITERKQAEELARQQREIIEAQQEILREVSTPIIPIMEQIIVVPLIGNIDTSRARDITRSLLSGITQYRAKMVILDITGVSVVDSGVADHLNKTIQAARLKGANTIITGISDAVAETVVDLGIDWSGVETLRDLQSGLLLALQRLGLKLG